MEATTGNLPLAGCEAVKKEKGLLWPMNHKWIFCCMEATTGNLPLAGCEAFKKEKGLLRPMNHKWIFGCMEATTGFEPVVRVLQTLALPLGHVALDNNKQLIVACTLERAMGLEPTTFSLARRRSTTEPRPHFCRCLTDDLEYSITRTNRQPFRSIFFLEIMARAGG